MPVGWTDNYYIRGWDAETFSGPLTGGSTGMTQSRGVVFAPTNSNNYNDPATWLTGWVPSGNLVVRVSCSPAAASSGGYAAFYDWSGNRLGQTAVDLSSGGPVDVTLPASAVTAEIQGIQIHAGDTDGHIFTLHSTAIAGAGPLEGRPTLQLGVSIYEQSRLSLAVDVFGRPAFAVAVAVSNSAVFSAAHGLRWSPLVEIGGVDVSARLSGAIRISAAEDAARVATLTLIPASPAQLDSLANSTVAIGVRLESGAYVGFYRLFTGRVEQVSDFNPAFRTVEISCRDGWQERPAACASAAAVHALFGGLATIAPKMMQWNDAAPDPAGYFNALLETLPGATFIDAGGLWRVVRWAIGAPAATFAAGDVFDESIVVSRRSRAELPGVFRGTLKHRHPRLHCAELALTWTRVNYTDFVVHGVPWLTKATAQAALDGLSGWKIKGKAVMGSPIPGTYGVLVGGNTVYYTISPEQAPLLCASLSATVYRRWYQEVETSYRFEIVIPGGSDREQAVSGAVASNFDSSAWESSEATDTGIDIWAANGPVPAVPPSGFEAQPLPYPPGNGAMDHWADMTQADLDACAAALVAKVVRQATAALRGDVVSFSRPIDPRWEIGTVLALNADGVAATGQVAEFEHVLDVNSGAAETTFRISCPSAAPGTTGSSATVSAPPVVVSHNLAPPTLGNHFGAMVGNTMTPNPDLLQGFLFNVLPSAAAYDGSVPIYHEQFRVIMPGIGAGDRNGVEQSGTLNASWSIAGGSLAINF